MPQEWNASAYHRVSGPQTSWGRKVLARVVLRGDERAIDAGCGSGRLTGALLDRLPRGRCVALDRSWNMLMTARANLRSTYQDRIGFVQVSLPELPFSGWADLLFSTATFHWVRDHDALFRNVLMALRPGGRLEAQCGGGPNLARAHALAQQVMDRPAFAAAFAGWEGPWEFASAEATAARLQAAGFADIETSVEEAPTALSTEADYREFVSTVIYHAHLARLADAATERSFIDEVTALAARDDPPFTLDYWRLNIRARRPA
jgi:trans-aconitate methyltransferase